MRIAIIEEENHINKYIKQYKEQYHSLYMESFHCSQFFIEEHTRHPFDILILDTDIEGIQSGINIRNKSAQLIIIVISSKKDYYHSYQIYPFQYIDKPVDKDIFKDTMTRLFYYCQSRYYLFKTYDYNVPIRIDNIIYIETMYTDMYVYTDDKVYIGSKRSNIKILHTLYLPTFYKLDRSHIINFSHIKIDAGYYIVMSNGNEIDISRNKRKTFKKNFIHYCHSYIRSSN